MKFEACIFDLDGVIVDTAKYHYLAWKRLADDLGIPFTEKDNERLKGVSRMDSLEIILEIGGLKIDTSKKEEYAALKNLWYVDYIKKMTPDEILPGALEFIAELKSENISVALGSASKNTPLILDRVNLSQLFDAVADGNIIHKAKPDPAVFLKAAEMLGKDPGKCVVFEDAVAGVQAALNAGMICIGIGSERVLSEAHAVVKGLSEMSLDKLHDLEKRLGYE
jgi:beta-phosphoglucomutase